MGDYAELLKTLRANGVLLKADRDAIAAAAERRARKNAKRARAKQ
jgi:hypothetical protein